MSATGRDFGIVWRFRTARFVVSLELLRDYNYIYDGDDPDGECQERLDNRDFVAFHSKVSVTLDGEEIGADYLGGSVYGADEVAEFFTAHHSSGPMNRNCTLMRRAWRGENDPNAKVSVCHYFPDMVRAAITLARGEVLDRKAELATLPYIRGEA